MAPRGRKGSSAPAGEGGVGVEGNVGGAGPARAFRTDLATPDGRVRVYVGDCRGILKGLEEVKRESIAMVFADPPFNWNRAYDRWKTTGKRQGDVEQVISDAAGYETWDDAIPREDYLDFTRQWIDLCVDGLRPGGSLWINIPDDTAAEIVVHCKRDRRLTMANWCIWHYRFGQNRTGAFINSKVHALHFVKGGAEPTWHPERVLEPSDRATTYFDPRTLSKKDGMPAGMRVPLDVWYGPYWGRVQGNNKERRPGHDNQLPEAYLERVILACTEKDDLVLDPFVGSGTTATVAHAYGRRFVGCEFSAANAKSAFQRITEIGMIAKGRALGQSTAIFKARGASDEAKARTRVWTGASKQGDHQENGDKVPGENSLSRDEISKKQQTSRRDALPSRRASKGQ